MKIKGNIICRIIHTEEIANEDGFSHVYYLVVRFQTTQLSSKSSCSFQDTFSVKRYGLEIASHEMFFISTLYSQPRNQVGSLFFSQISVSLGFKNLFVSLSFLLPHFLKFPFHSRPVRVLSSSLYQNRRSQVFLINELFW